MPKPFVVFVPESDRATLRENGALPRSVFHDFDMNKVGDDVQEEVCINLWPYGIDYNKAAILAKQISASPVNVGELFGMPDAKSRDERDHADRTVVHMLLHSVMVHILFLDERHDDDGYAKITSFSNITEWSRHYQTIISTRFRNEYRLEECENILVVVARTALIKSDPSDLIALQSSIGPDKMFKSCYFVDYNLSVGTGRTVLHSKHVWEALVSRLLLTFILSQQDGNPVWKLSGSVKVFGVSEYTAMVEETICRGQITQCLDSAYTQITTTIHSDLDKKVSSWNAPVSALSSEQLKPNTNHEENSIGNNWFDFNGQDFVERITGVSRWAEAFKKIRENVAASDMREDDASPDGVNFSDAHQDLLSLFRMTNALEANLENERDTILNEINLANNGFTSTIAIEGKRLDILTKLSKAASEFDKARTHYVTKDIATLVVVGLSLACGFLIGRVVFTLGGSLLYSIALAGCVGAGASLAAFAMRCLHRSQGIAAAQQLIALGHKADSTMIERDEAAWENMKNARTIRARLRRLSTHSIALSLLTRARMIIDKELSPASVPVDFTGISGKSKALPTDSTHQTEKSNQMETLSRCIGERQVLEGGQANTADLDNLIEARFGTDGEIHDKWRKFCSIYDTASAGHFPAVFLVPKTRGFMTKFITDMKEQILRQAILTETQELADRFSKWATQAATDCTSEFFSAATDGVLRETERWIYWTDAFSAATEKGIKQNVDHAVNGINNHSVKSSKLTSFGRLGFSFTQIAVDFAITPDGFLTFKKARDMEAGRA